MFGANQFGQPFFSESYQPYDLVLAGNGPYINTPRLYEVVLDYMPDLSISSFSPLSGDVDVPTVVTIIGTSMNRVTAVYLNGYSLSFTAIDWTTLQVTVSVLLFVGSYPFYLVCPTKSVYSSDLYTVYLAKYGNPYTISQRLRMGKSLSRFGFIKFPSK